MTPIKLILAVLLAFGLSVGVVSGAVWAIGLTPVVLALALAFASLMLFGVWRSCAQLRGAESGASRWSALADLLLFLVLTAGVTIFIFRATGAS